MYQRIIETGYDICDCILAVALIFLSAPVLLITALVIKIDSSGPVFYTQERYGKDKKPFRIYKLRTMRLDAETSRPVWGTEDDPRATRIGRFLRVTHIDELPQLFNVLEGSMSLVGPRPERPYFASKFAEIIPLYEDRYRVKPGITGWAQVNGLRGESSVFQRTDCDLYYIDNRSLAFNLKIMLMTPFAKPIQHHVHPEVAEHYLRTLPQALEVIPGSMPLMVPIKNA